jgi:lysophospholipase L1-like esterase
LLEIYKKMNDNFSSPSILLKQGVGWLKSRQKKLAKNMVTQMAGENDIAQRKMPALLRRFVATDMVGDLIKRLETNSFESQETRRKMLRGLKRGATVQSMVK